MEEYEQKLIELFNSTLLPGEAKMYVLFKHVRDVQDAVKVEKEQKRRKESEKNEQMSHTDRMAE